MKHTTQFLLAAAIALLVAGSFAFPQPEGDKKSEGGKKAHRIVFQLTTPDTSAYRALTRQLNNVLAQWPEAQIEVVAHNKGMGMLEKKKSNVPAELAALQSKGVQFVACERTLKQLKIEKTDLIPGPSFVERGIIHIVERQEQGWSYIKAGF